MSANYWIIVDAPRWELEWKFLQRFRKNYYFRKFTTYDKVRDLVDRFIEEFPECNVKIGVERGEHIYFV